MIKTFEIGKTYHQLRVDDIIGNKLICTCKCGNKVEVTKTLVKRNRRKSCGCLMLRNRRIASAMASKEAARLGF